MKKILDTLKKVFTNKYVRLGLVAVFSIAALYLVYTVLMSVFAWTRQPDFLVSDGSTTKSLGFLVQAMIYGIILVVVSAIDVTLILLFYRKKKPQEPPTNN